MVILIEENLSGFIIGRHELNNNLKIFRGYHIDSRFRKKMKRIMRQGYQGKKSEMTNH